MPDPGRLPNLSGVTIVLGVTGSIAAYKAADLCSKLVQSGATVHPILSRGATRFIAPATFFGLSGQPVTTDTFEEPFSATTENSPIAHLRYAEIADLFVVAPASADFLARLTAGFADDMLTAALLANPGKPVLLAPAMNSHMWENAATRANRRTLEGRGYLFAEPAIGRLAEGTTGTGRMKEPADLLRDIADRLTGKGDLSGVRVLVTAGPTREPIDPVRFLSNRSSGKMGYAIAAAAAARGADVTLVSGPTGLPVPAGVTTVGVLTAAEMASECLARFPDCDIAIAAAAVADFTPETAAPQKIKKQGNSLVLTLVPTIDILRSMGQRKRSGQILVGFAAETENLQANAQAKLREKNLDLIVANDITQEGAGFDVDTNLVTLLEPDRPPHALALTTKHRIAEILCDWLAARRTTATAPPNAPR
ncbi:MAG: bifunctional phosphopantothenoylcysteine decarboxylase/phosphopantothenate--cysteine ligase CoaBC [Capsulimonadales bacterium]|nr:bifunctional phosphopantothenoylcysteine decarboxylase/phosphopantothenate--cysteine ligase CoaBC [Capsulimonadales bacterium]